MVRTTFGLNKTMVIISGRLFFFMIYNYFLSSFNKNFVLNISLRLLCKVACCRFHEFGLEDFAIKNLDTKLGFKLTFLSHLLVMYKWLRMQLVYFKLNIGLFQLTFPSHISLRLLPVVAFVSLDWKSLPSKKSHGQHSSHGIGAPQASLANRAASMPRMNMAASCTPRGVILCTW